MRILSDSQRAKKFFNLISPLYDVIKVFIYTKSMKDRLLSEREEGLILDVGCGTGYTSRGLCCVGIDISERMLVRAGGMRVLVNGEKPSFRKNPFLPLFVQALFIIFLILLPH